jgi:uncharacterized protein YjiK
MKKVHFPMKTLKQSMRTIPMGWLLLNQAYGQGPPANVIVSDTAPYGQNFNGLTSGNLHNQAGWSVDLGTANVVAHPTVANSKWVLIVPESEGPPVGQISIGINLTSAPQVLYAQFKVKPVPGPAAEAEFVDSTGAATGFFSVGSSGELTVLNGNGHGGGVWMNTGVRPQLAGSGGWMTLVIRQDFVAKAWDLYMIPGGATAPKLVAGDLGFWDDTQITNKRFILVGSTVGELLLDDVNLSSSVTWDTDRDGLIDAWENTVGGLGTARFTPTGVSNLALMAQAAAYAEVPVALNAPGSFGDFTWMSLAGVSQQALRVDGVKQDLSGVAFDPAKRQFLAIQNGGGKKVYQLGFSGAVSKVYSPTGRWEVPAEKTGPRGFDDPEGICWKSGNEFAIAEEKERRILLCTLGDEAFNPRIYRALVTNGTKNIKLTAAAGQSQSLVTALSATDNYGLEGIAWNAAQNCFYGVIEGDVPNGTPPQSAKPAFVVRISETGTTTVMEDISNFLATVALDLADIAYDASLNQLYVLSERTKRIWLFQLNPSGTAGLSPLPPPPSIDLALQVLTGSGPLTIPETWRPEGLCVIPGEGIAVVGEPDVFCWWTRTTRNAPTGILITEFMAKNDTGIMDASGSRPDWIEIYNAGPNTESLSGVAVSDGNAPAESFNLPGISLPAGEFLLLFASGKVQNGNSHFLDSDGHYHLPFKLSASANSVLRLIDSDGAVRQRIVYPAQANDVSYGLPSLDYSVGAAGGGMVMKALPIPTPGAANTTAVLGPLTAAPVIAAVGPWLSTGTTTVTITPAPGTSCYFTINGTEPYPENPDALLYSTPVVISRSMMLKAAGVQSGCRPSPVVFRTFLVAPQLAAQSNADALWFSETNGVTDERSLSGTAQGLTIDYTASTVLAPSQAAKDAYIASLKKAPIVSIAGDPEDIFYPEEGIYANSASSGDDWERRVAVDFIPAVDTSGAAALPVIAANQVFAGLRMSGNSTRYQDVTKKHNFKLKFRHQYGQAPFVYPGLFGAGAAFAFETLLLRQPSHDSWVVDTPYFAENRASAKYVTDRWADMTMRAIGYQGLNRRWVHVFLNGLYWGVYELMEEPDNDFLKTRLAATPPPPATGKLKYDVVEADYQGAEQGTQRRTAWAGVLASASNVWQQAYGNAQISPAVTSAYATITNPAEGNCINVTNLVDYILLNAFIANTDWPAHNYLAVRREDQPWQFMSWDAEYAARKATPLDINIMSRLTLDQGSGYSGSRGPATIYRMLRYAPAFRALVRQRLTALTTGAGPLAVSALPTSATSTFTAELNRFDPLVEAELGRWGDVYRATPYTRAGDWAVTRTWVTGTFLPARLTHFSFHVLDDLLQVEEEIAIWEGQRNTPLPTGSALGQPVVNAGPSTALEAPRKDADGDGMPDAWEILYGLNPASAADASADADGDGLSNYMEYVFGSIPNISASAVWAGARDKFQILTRFQP